MKWKMNLRYMKPSGGGAQGVVFVWDSTTQMNQRTDPATSSFVIKPIQGTGSATKFAETMLKKIAKASSPKSKPIPRNSLTGKTLVSKFKEAMSLENDQKVKARWAEVMQHYEGAESFLLQETQDSIKEFGDVLHDGGLRGMLRDPVLMKNLGKLFAADAIIGNGDRLCMPNSGNIVFKADGTISAIDSSTILTNFNAVVTDTTQSASIFAQSANPSPNMWAKDILRQGGVAVPTQKQQAATLPGHSPLVPPGFGMSLLFDVDKWWNQTFRPHLENGLRRETEKRAADAAAGGVRLPPMVPPRADEWSDALANFKRGVDEGVKKTDSTLSGFNWMGVKSKYKSYVSKYGGDPNLDWTNLKVRRVYFKARKKGKNDEQAMAVVTEYVKKKFPGI